MRVGYVLVAAVAALVTVFALQNTDPATVRFLVWRIETVPVALLVLASLGAGLLVAGLPLAIRLRVWRSRARSQESRASMLQAAVEERDRKLLQTPPRGRGTASG
jgi:uncharacterized integral membrane protein